VDPILVEHEGDDILAGGALVGVHHGLHPRDGRVLVAGLVGTPHLGVGLDGGVLGSLDCSQDQGRHKQVDIDISERRGGGGGAYVDVNVNVEVEGLVLLAVLNIGETWTDKKTTEVSRKRRRARGAVRWRREYR
jgi:hypothetical protein